MQQLMVVFIFLTILLSVLYYAIIIYYRFAYKALPIYNTTNNLETHKPSTFNLQPSTLLSIIIPARNEAANIENCINSILQNNYPTHLFEIIVVDDHSEDDTVSIVKKYATQNVKLILLKDFITNKINAYKKKAIEVAIAQASGTLIITTDADCIVPPNWLQTIASFYEATNAKFIAAPVAIEGGMKVIGLFQSLDFMTLQGITAAVVHKKQMTMCNGANMAYEKLAFDEVGGFAGIDNIASGDDMLLMHKIYKRYPNNVLFLNSKEAIVKTAPVNTIAQFFNQRIRWASKADKYDDKRILPVLVVVYFFNVVMFILPIIAVFTTSTISILNTQYSILSLWLWLFLFKIIVELFFLFPVASFFGKKSMLCFFPLMQPFHICYTIIAGWLGKFGKYTWKERSVS
jgi:cellulose synthase/poly-beta-1,6-N-acetylglucosamine synthase-like glycosyltransferase